MNKFPWKHCQYYSYTKIYISNISPSLGWEWPLHGSLAESTSLMKDAGEKDNLMTLAFKLRNERVIYEYKSVVTE